MKSLTFFSLLLCVSCLSSCKKDSCTDISNPACRNYDPCYQKTSVSADFNIYEVLNGIPVEADTLWVNSQISLVTRYQKNCTIKWRIKSLTMSYTSSDSITSFFPYAVTPSLTPSQMYTVTLIVSKDNGECSSVKSVDSASKVVYLWPDQYDVNFNGPYNYLPIFGTYAGYKTSNPNQLVYVTLFDTILTVPNLPCNGNNAGIKLPNNLIKNLAYNNFGTQNFSWGVGGFISRYGASGLIFDKSLDFFYNNPNGCYGSKFLVAYDGIAWLDLANSKRIYINYRYKDTVTYQWVTDYFTGLKTN